MLRRFPFELRRQYELVAKASGLICIIGIANETNPTTTGRPMLKTILVPVDGSGYADRAIDYASHLASRLGAKIILLHVMAPAKRQRYRHLPDEIRQYAATERLLGADEIFPVVEEIFASADAHAVEELLKRSAARAKNAGAEEIAQESVEGNPAETILDNAKSFDVDTIVMGSRGLSEMKGLMVGSVSQRVLHHADVPVTIVR